MPLVALTLGYDVMWLDFDLYLVRDPTARVLGMARGSLFPRNVQEESPHTDRLRAKFYGVGGSRGNEESGHDESPTADMPGVASLTGDRFSVLTKAGEGKYFRSNGPEPTEAMEQLWRRLEAEQQKRFPRVGERAVSVSASSSSTEDQDYPTAPLDILLIMGLYSFLSDCLCRSVGEKGGQQGLVCWGIMLVRGEARRGGGDDGSGGWRRSWGWRGGRGVEEEMGGSGGDWGGVESKGAGKRGGVLLTSHTREPGNSYKPSSSSSTEDQARTIREKAVPMDIIMGYSFLSDCLCDGFFYLKATPAVVEWTRFLLVWLYQHPYEHDQRAMSALLNYTEKVSLSEERGHRGPSLEQINW